MAKLYRELVTEAYEEINKLNAEDKQKLARLVLSVVTKVDPDLRFKISTEENIYRIRFFPKDMRPNGVAFSTNDMSSQLFKKEVERIVPILHDLEAEIRREFEVEDSWIDDDSFSIGVVL